MIVTLLAFASTLFLITWLNRRSGYPSHLPPGPKPIPILGNLGDFTSKELWVKAAKWADKYGDVCYLHVFGWSVIFLSSPDAAFELLEKRGAMYSDKPKLKMVGDLCGCRKLLPFLSYNSEFTQQRRYLKQTLGSRSIPAYYSTIRASTNSFLVELINSPSQYLEHLRKYAGGLVLSVGYGYQVRSTDDKFLVQAEECVQLLANRIVAGSGIWLVDVFPVMAYLPSWMPGAGFKKKAMLWKRMMREFVDAPFEEAKASVKSGTILPSFCSDILDGDEPLNSSEEENIKYSANSMFAASADTTVTTMSHFILAMMLYPDVLKKAQAEIDKVIGPDRLLDLTDRPALPYVDAILSEVWRWGAPVPLNLPHCVRQDDQYRGMYIPKGSFIIVNIWAILRNEQLFPEPENFRPERFLPVPGVVPDPRQDPRSYVFGFGRRRCPGADLSESSIWLLIASMIAVLDIRKPDAGDIPVRYNNSVFRVPDKLQCEIKPRSDNVLSLLE